MRSANGKIARLSSPIDTRHSLLNISLSPILLLRPRLEELLIVLEFLCQLGAEFSVDVFTVRMLVGSD
jgi:hypothetical protein